MDITLGLFTRQRDATNAVTADTSFLSFDGIIADLATAPHAIPKYGALLICVHMCAAALHARTPF